MLKNLKRHLINIPGWRTKRKIVVFESDDWGMIRMASKDAYDRFLKKGYPVDRCPYNINDALESNQDLESLAEVLLSVKDKNGRPAKFTMNNIVANPDFAKIKASAFREYYYEPFVETLKRYPFSDKVVEYYRQGLSEAIFQVQFHGREHVNINRWMSALRGKNPRFVDAFEEKMFTIASGINVSGRRDYLDAFGVTNSEEFESPQSIIELGSGLFEELWGFRSVSFIAPCYIWSSDIEPALISSGIKYIQGTHVQRVPVEEPQVNIRRKYHYQGQKNHLGLLFLIRNVFFEPTENRGNVAEVDRAMSQIELAFQYRKPAIISSHRVNYIGRINENNRNENLSLLKLLLSLIVKKHPDVEFMSTDELGKLISGN